MSQFSAPQNRFNPNLARNDTLRLMDEVQNKIDSLRNYYERTVLTGLEPQARINALLSLNDELRVTDEYLHHHLQHLPAIRHRTPPRTQTRSQTYTTNAPGQLGVEVVTTITTTSSNDLPESLMGLVRDLVGNAPFGEINVEDLRLQEDVVVGLDKTTIRKMKTRRYHLEREKRRKHRETPDVNIDDIEPDACCICMKDYTDNVKLRVLPCKHEFHKKCIDRWFERHVKCPVCRLDVRDVLT